MADKYITSQSDLTSVADAIRTKGGTSGKLIFPAGFVSAIQNIPSGGSVPSMTDTSFLFYEGARKNDLTQWLALIPNTGWLKAKGMFQAAALSRSSIDLREYDGSAMTENSNMFQNIGNCPTIYLPKGFKIAGSRGGQFRDNNALKKIESYNGFTLDASSNTKSLAYLFANDSHLTHIPYDIESWDTSNIIDMSNIFNVLGFYAGEDASFDTPLNLSGWDVSNVQNLTSAFQACSYPIDGIEEWEVGANAYYLSINNIFAQCTWTKELDLRKWNVSQVTSQPSSLFYQSNFEKINLEGWDFSKVSYGYLSSVFNRCQAREINANFVSTGNMSGSNRSMASECPNLEVFRFRGNWAKLTLGSFEFWNDTNLRALIIGEDTSGEGNILNLINTVAFSSSGIEAGTGMIYVPDNLVEKYKGATNWAKFADQIKPVSEFMG